MAGAIPQQHLPSGHRIYIISEIPVGSEYYFLVGGKRLHYFAGVDDVTTTSVSAFTAADVLT